MEDIFMWASAFERALVKYNRVRFNRPSVTMLGVWMKANPRKVRSQNETWLRIELSYSDAEIAVAENS